MSPPPKQRAPNPYDIPTPASYSLSPHAHPMHTYQHSPGAASGSGSASWSGAPAPESSSSRVPKQEFDDEEDEDTLASPPPGEVKKAKTTRGSRACTVCRKLKMRCVGAEQGPPCKRCKSGNHEVRQFVTPRSLTRRSASSRSRSVVVARTARRTRWPSRSRRWRRRSKRCSSPSPTRPCWLRRAA